MRTKSGEHCFINIWTKQFIVNGLLCIYNQIYSKSICICLFLFHFDWTKTWFHRFSTNMFCVSCSLDISLLLWIMCLSRLAISYPYDPQFNQVNFYCFWLLSRCWCQAAQHWGQDNHLCVITNHLKNGWMKSQRRLVWSFSMWLALGKWYEYETKSTCQYFSGCNCSWAWGSCFSTWSTIQITWPRLKRIGRFVMVDGSYLWDPVVNIPIVIVVINGTSY